jgi:hypothetical protein
VEGASPDAAAVGGEVAAPDATAVGGGGATSDTVVFKEILSHTFSSSESSSSCSDSSVAAEMTAAFRGRGATFFLRLEEISLLYIEVFLKRGF